MKSYQFFKIYKRLDKEREKTLVQQSMGKVWLYFITGCFIFYFTSSFAAQVLLFDMRMTQEI